MKPNGQPSTPPTLADYLRAAQGTLDMFTPDTATRDAMKRGRFVFKLAGNHYTLDSINGDALDLWSVLDALFPTA